MDGPSHFDPSATPRPGGLKPPADLPGALADLRSSGWESVSVAEEMRRNTAKAIAAGASLVPGVLGFEDTVVPQLETAILAGHDLILLGERGQAKTRVIRSLVGLLDEWTPIVAGSEINDDPYNPVSRYALDRVDELGEATPIDWVHRSQRYGEKLATPDTSIADLIGEVDPIKIAEGRYLSDELALHYGLIPRVNRGIFAINELPDLSERIQVGLLNILEERDVQIRGHRIRLPLDIMLVATANPEDYTNRGRIITPLKDRFGAQIRTHYPFESMTEVKIMEGEADLPTAGVPVTVPRVHEGGGGRDQPAGPAQLPPQPAQRRLGPPLHRQLRDAGRLRRAARPAHRRARGGAAHQRPGGAGPLDPGQDRGRGDGGGARGRGRGPAGGRGHAGRVPPPGHPRRPAGDRRPPSTSRSSCTWGTTSRRRPTWPCWPTCPSWSRRRASSPAPRRPTPSRPR